MNRELIIKLENASSKMKELLPNDDSQFLIDCHNEVMSVIRETQQALTQPIITNEQVKESIEYFKNRNSFEIPVYDTPQFYNIAQYIVQLEVELMKREAAFEIISELSKVHTIKLDKIGEIDNRLSKMEWTSRQARALRYEKEVKSILKEESNE